VGSRRVLGKETLHSRRWGGSGGVSFDGHSNTLNSDAVSGLKLPWMIPEPSFRGLQYGTAATAAGVVRFPTSGLKAAESMRPK
jgi:hypothetical protein